jgi:TonB family protein
MQLPLERSKRRFRSVVSSSLFHAAVLASVILVGISSRKHAIRIDRFEKVARIDIAGGSHQIRVPLPPMPFAAHTREPNRDTDATKNTILPVPTSQRKLFGGGTPPSPHNGDGSGNALFGNGSDNQDVRPAFPIFSPRPPVTDRSLLPSTEQKIVVDVDVDAQGAVVNENLVRGMGNRLDQMVLDIVKTWRFQPATVDGKPVPAQAEVIFPFNLDYPIAAS